MKEFGLAKGVYESFEHNFFVYCDHWFALSFV
jgi:hypothetical protein